jgi:3-deoxy-7-phosphoheptulonate synthase
MKIKNIFTPNQLKSEFKLSAREKKNIYLNTREIKKIVANESNKFLVILGPCSVYDCKATLQYAYDIAKLYKSMRKKLFFVLRMFTTKQRTNTNKFKGITHQADLNSSESIYDGLIAERKIIIDVIKTSGLAIANEIVYPNTFDYTDDLISYYVLGARSMNNQEHKLLASNLNIAVGIKNSLDGSLNILFNSLIAVHGKHRFIHAGYEIETNGNSFSHVILRGIECDSGFYPNYHYEDLLGVIKRYPNLQNKLIIVDSNHANSCKNYKEQPRIIKEVMFNRKQNNVIRNNVRGLMLESFIKSGTQERNQVFGKSLTDSCLSFGQTKNILEYIYEHI